MTDLREHLQLIYQERGRLTPRIVLDVARDPEHPLHSRFTWDDAEAAEKYRLGQAHELIQSVKVSYRDDSGRPKDVRQFHAVRREHEYVYEPLDEIANDDVTRQILLRDMERDWKTLKKRYDSVREFFDMVRRDLDAA